MWIAPQSLAPEVQVPRQSFRTIGRFGPLDRQGEEIETVGRSNASGLFVPIQCAMAEAGGIAAQRLKSFIERIERLEEEKAALAADVREVYSEAKGEGFDAKIMRQIVRLRKMDNNDRQEQEAILDLYKAALGTAE